MATKPKKSKRHTLSKLASDWRERIFENIQSERLKSAVAVLSATGCRPSELERGVIVNFSDGQLRLAIQGSKLDSDRGQPVRVVWISTCSPWGKYLVEKIERLNTDTLLVNYDAGGISQRLREKSRELWPRRKTLVSAYSYRHYLGKSLKESGEPPDKIACALGHASDYSQHVYGRAGKGKKSSGQHGIVHAKASRPVRHSNKSNRLEKLLSQSSSSKSTPGRTI